MQNTSRFLLLLACGWSLGACFGGKEDGPPPPDGRDMAAEKAKAQEEKEKEDADKKLKEEQARTAPKKEEFLLTLVADDPAVAQIDAINIDVISATAGEAARLEAMGPVKYRDSRQSGGNTRSHVFRKGGRFEVKVPTIPATDTVLLWAELAAPASGNDSRMLVVPLALDKSDPSKPPVANPITVKLTPNGWVRVN